MFHLLFLRRRCICSHLRIPLERSRYILIDCNTAEIRHWRISAVLIV